MMVALLIAAALDPASAAIAASLPPGLELVEASIPARIAGRTPVSVAWRTPPRAGASRVEISTPSARAWVLVMIAAVEQRPTAARALPAGHVVTEEDVVVERLRGRRPALAPAVVVGATTRDALRAGDELTADVVALAPPLARGTLLTARVVRGALLVSQPARLEAPARVGEVARIRLDATARVTRARLTSPDTAVLELESHR